MENKAVLEPLWKHLTAKSKISLSLCSKKIYSISKNWGIEFDEEVLLKTNCIEWLEENTYNRGMNGGVTKYVFCGRRLAVKICFYLGGFPFVEQCLYSVKVKNYNGYGYFYFEREKVFYSETEVKERSMRCVFDEDLDFLKRFKETFKEAQYIYVM